MNTTDHIYKVICDRLKRVTRPFFGWVRLEQLRSVAVQPHIEIFQRPVEKDADYMDFHLGRVKFFVEEIRHGRALDPISIETRWFQSHPMNPILEDGHHRWAAAEAMGEKRILATFGGLVLQLDWLTGKHETPSKRSELSVSDGPRLGAPHR